MPSFEAVSLNHIARETLDVVATAKFYQDLFAFERIPTPKEFGDTVIWLKVPPSHYLHIIKKNPDSKLPESPLNAPPDARRVESDLPEGHHVAFRVGDYNAAIAVLKEKKIPYYEKTQQEGSIHQCFFFDPDGNGIEIGDWPLEQPFSC